MRALVLLLVTVAGYLALRWLLRQRYGLGIGVLLSGVGLGLVSLAAIGRLPWVFLLIGGLLPALMVVLSARQRHRERHRRDDESSGRQSVVETRYLRMTLDHDSGEMAGRVLAGRFAGSALDALSQRQLVEMLNDFAAEDDDSAALLRAYLDRTFGTDWEQAKHAHRAADGLSGEMSRSDAFAILGLEEGASREQIIAAHGRLIQRLHPDRGGSTFLATKINQARDLLLDT